MTYEVVFYMILARKKINLGLQYSIMDNAVLAQILLERFVLLNI